MFPSRKPSPMHLKKTATALFALLTVSANASPFVKADKYTVKQDQVIANEQWVSSNTAKTEGVFKNDLFISSNSELILAGTYEGNIWGFSGTETEVNGSCLRNVRLAGQTIRMDGAVQGNLMAMANTISIGTNAVVSGDARLKGTQIIVEGSITGNLDVTALQTVTISGQIAGNAMVTAPEIILADDARITGNLTYTTSKELIPADGVVTGTLRRVLPESAFSAARIQRHVLFFLAALLTGVTFISLFPMTTAMASLLVRSAPLKCMSVGLLSLIFLVVFALIGIYSVIGLPLGLVTLASCGIMLYTSRIIVGLMLGTLILKSGNTSAGRVLLSMTVGLAVIYGLTFIPSGIDQMVQFIVACTGVGALLLALLQKRRLIIKVPEELKQIEALKNQQSKPTEE